MMSKATLNQLQTYLNHIMKIDNECVKENSEKHNDKYVPSVCLDSLDIVCLNLQMVIRQNKSENAKYIKKDK